MWPNSEDSMSFTLWCLNIIFLSQVKVSFDPNNVMDICAKPSQIPPATAAMCVCACTALCPIFLSYGYLHTVGFV